MMYLPVDGGHYLVPSLFRQRTAVLVEMKCKDPVVQSDTRLLAALVVRPTVQWILVYPVQNLTNHELRMVFIKMVVIPADS